MEEERRTIEGDGFTISTILSLCKKATVGLRLPWMIQSYCFKAEHGQHMRTKAFCTPLYFGAFFSFFNVEK